MGTRMQFVDDVSGEEIPAEGAQVTFAFQGTTYEIDLGEENRAAISADFEKWITFARIVRPGPVAARRRNGAGRPTSAPTGTAGKITAANDENAMARAWFKSTGGEIGIRGRLPSHVLAGYREGVARGQIPAEFLVSDSAAAGPDLEADEPADDTQAAVGAMA
ncbi:Lsr2 dimerization domain-containing protein [Pseudonocardia xinjiangensis]|uniref:Lsr2 dimerization domain-containing protein n=1 Tax=Pseudonocardia xinjiangensis TaxID=75289 RepID=UPI003D91772C